LTKNVFYRKTILSCYLGFVIQAATVNITPILFLTLREMYNISFEQLGFLTFINFITQVACDLIFSKAADKYGFRPFILATPLVATAGFFLFAITPFIFNNVYLGFVISTIIFASASGLLEVLLSPIMNSIPHDEKEGAMSLLHSFYSWGQAFVILATTFLLFVLGKRNWQIIMLLWIILPLADFFLFLSSPIPSPIPEEERTEGKKVFWHPYFILAFIAITFGGASELTITGWISAFLEAAVKIPKVAGDSFGVSFFAIMMGLGRLLYGLNSNRINLNKFMILGSLLTCISYLVIAVSPIPFISLVFCALCGFGVSLLWPGNLVLASNKFPKAGTWIFAVLAAGGDIGASVGPWLVGFITDKALAYFKGAQETFALKLGMSAGVVFSLLCFATLCVMYGMDKKHKT